MQMPLHAATATKSSSNLCHKPAVSSNTAALQPTKGPVFRDGAAGAGLQSRPGPPGGAGVAGPLPAAAGEGPGLWWCCWWCLIAWAAAWRCGQQLVLFRGVYTSRIHHTATNNTLSTHARATPPGPPRARCSWPTPRCWRPTPTRCAPLGRVYGRARRTRWGGWQRRSAVMQWWVAVDVLGGGAVWGGGG